jgi:integrase/recombinase XerD
MNSAKASTLACTLNSFFTDYLPRQRALSPHTLHSYRDSLKLLLQFVAAGKNGDPSQLTVEALTLEHVTAFLHHLERERGNQSSTRNVRLSAVHSFFRYVGGQCPEHLAQAQRILSVPFKRTAAREIQHLDFDEIMAVLGAIDRSTGQGRRDLALLGLMFNTGARVSEIVGLQTADLRLASPPSVVLRGKGRKERTCPLWPETAHLLQKLVEERGLQWNQSAALFLNQRGTPLTRFGIRLIVRKHIRKAAQRKSSLKNKRLHPHSFRHSTAVHLLRSGVDLSTIAHWLGHASVNTTNKYLAVDLEAKREALAKAEPLLKANRRSANWRRDRNLIAWLETL